MPSIRSLLVAALSVSTLFASPLNKRGCQNTPTSRGCWGSFSIEDDPHDVWPNTGVTREYHLRIGHKTLAPDGVPKQMMVINGQYPGPTIEGNWGDDIVVHVYNELTTNGTGIHWHGVRQLFNNPADGAVSQTECPIPPGGMRTYRWKATQHGSGWYHSHYSLQYTDGVLGPIVIHGPRTANYDIDLGPVLMTDHYHESAFKLQEKVSIDTLGLPPVADNGLINGKNVYKKGGAREEFVFTPGKKHLLRLANVGSEVTFRFSVDKHKMTVVAMDWTPIKPYETKTLFIGVGQRYDVIIEADQEPKDYWLRARPMLACLAVNAKTFNIRGIVRYDKTSTAEPDTLSHTIADVCVDESPSDLVPYHFHQVGLNAINDTGFSANLRPELVEKSKLRWNIGLEPYIPPKDSPTALSYINGVAPKDMDTYLVPVDLTSLGNEDKWVYIILQSSLPLAHPIHLHGHDVYVLGRGGGLFFEHYGLNLENPTRRDTVNLPATGWLALAFRLDNPGAWLLHCHIQWHLHHGFGMSVIEGTRKQVASVWASRKDEEERICRAWKATGLESRH
ncbi:hypothetical protein BJ508DRAFT_239962 [Ascobolus immersus RN42]|uniref:Multicopper oxidase n=1 Tax=Ascobolus immersus RN42 TaxID=1160509 RepID=A0A3N4I4T2_ASCIM|nr:hypothetical protein BJ508DRAFT_239962 [Ascobolus immersus RN42]